MSKFGPTAHLGSLIDNWRPYYIKGIQAVLDGTGKSSQTWAGFADNDIILGPLGNMPDDVKKARGRPIEKIKSGQFFVFTGPIYKQDGTLAAKDGEKMDDGALLGMNWYVKGIDDKLPSRCQAGRAPARGATPSSRRKPGSTAPMRDLGMLSGNQRDRAVDPGFRRGDG